MKFCPRCGRKCEDNDNYCLRCGYNFSENVTQNDTSNNNRINNTNNHEHVTMSDILHSIYLIFNHYFHNSSNQSYSSMAKSNPNSILFFTRHPYVLVWISFTFAEMGNFGDFFNQGYTTAFNPSLHTQFIHFISFTIWALLLSGGLSYYFKHVSSLHPITDVLIITIPIFIYDVCFGYDSPSMATYYTIYDVAGYFMCSSLIVVAFRAMILLLYLIALFS